MQALVPEVGAKDPATHAPHVIAELDAAYLPAAQLVQLVAAKADE